VSKPKYDSTVARIAGNILSGYSELDGADAWQLHKAAEGAVKLARAIVEEVRRTEPAVEGSIPQPSPDQEHS